MNGRKDSLPLNPVQPVSSKKQCLGIAATCTFLGGMDRRSLERLRADKDERFPKPLQILSGSPVWSLEQLERYIARKEKEVESLSA